MTKLGDWMLMGRVPHSFVSWVLYVIAQGFALATAISLLVILIKCIGFFDSNVKEVNPTVEYRKLNPNCNARLLGEFKIDGYYAVKEVDFCNKSITIYAGGKCRKFYLVGNHGDTINEMLAKCTERLANNNTDPRLPFLLSVQLDGGAFYQGFIYAVGKEFRDNSVQYDEAVKQNIDFWDKILKKYREESK